CQNPETYKPKFHCRRQSGMNFGYVTVNGVNSNIVWKIYFTTLVHKTNTGYNITNKILSKKGEPI
ncbi:MAG: hypothetical protein KH021_11095, partial [Ruminococcus sp.]|nr:hypothetical protein [Ruminococcus sp.]